MKGAFLGDIIGSRFEFKGSKSDIKQLEDKKIALTNKLVKAIEEQKKLFHRDKTIMKDLEKCYKKHGNPRTIESELKELDRILNDLKK